MSRERQILENLVFSSAAEICWVLDIPLTEQNNMICIFDHPICGVDWDLAKKKIYSILLRIYYRALFEKKALKSYDFQSEDVEIWQAIRNYHARDFRKYTNADYGTAAAMKKFCDENDYFHGPAEVTYRYMWQIIRFYHNGRKLFSRPIATESGVANPRLDACAIMHLVFKTQCACWKIAYFSQKNRGGEKYLLPEE